MTSAVAEQDADASRSAGPSDTDGILPISARARTAFGLALYTALVYLPILAMHPGKVDADTKSYLYLDPSRFLERAASIWDPSIGFGTLTHQTIGYLFPMGPFYWVTEAALGLPAWVAQRLWLATLILLAGLGVRYLLRAFDVRGPGVPIAMLAYSFSPYVLGYSAIYSVMLSPWSALPWWIAFVVYAMRRGGWKYPALFALTVQLAGALNGSALLFSLLGPALYIPYAVLVIREANWRRAWTVVWRIGILSFLTSLWWFVPLAIEGQYGLDILRYTESVEIVSQTSLPFEVLRGLGNWYFYGKDRVGFWADARVDFTQRAVFIFVSMIVPALALLSAGLLRWRQRAYFVLLALLGIAIAVGAEPYADPSVLGNVYKQWALQSNLGFALRNTGRAAPLVVLSFAVLLGVGVTALVSWMRARRREVWGLAIATLVGVLCLANAVPALNGKYYSRSLERDEAVPGYWTKAIRDLDAESHDTRVLDLPGSDFTSYRWGDTRDPIEPGLMDRPFVARELVPWGSAPSANLLQALDRRVQESESEPAALAPVARLMGVGDVVLRLDLQTDRWSLIPAGELWQQYGEHGTPGFDAAKRYGKRIPGALAFPEIGDLTKPKREAPSPPPVAVMKIQDPLAIVRAKSTDAPVVVDGDGEGVMDLAGAGLLDPKRLLLYAAPYEQDRQKLRDLPTDSLLVLTDSNRRRGMRWSGLHENYGYTEQAGEKPLLDDPSDQRLIAFPDATDESATVTILDGVESVRATRYGTSFGLQPDDRPTQAIDGDLDTSWLVDGGQKVGDHRLQVTLDHPITTDRMDVVQLFKQEAGPRLRRFIRNVTITFDGGRAVHARLGRASRSDAGQEIRFPRRTFKTFEIGFDGVPEGKARSARARNAVGFTEIRVRDDAPGAQAVRVGETTRMPQTMLDALGARSLQHPLAIVMTRESTMDQAAVSRRFTLPAGRSFSLSGTAEIGEHADDDAIDRAFGLPDASQGGVTATSEDRLERPAARASSAVDGDPTTAWNTPIELPDTNMTVTTPGPTTLDHLDLQVVADGRHSLPRRLEITSDNGTTRVVDLPTIPRRAPGGVASVPVRFEPITGSSFTVAVKRVDRVRRSALVMPVGIAELGIPGVTRAPMPTTLPDTCRTDLVTVDGKPFPVRITGSTEDALARKPLGLTPCDPGETVQLDAGAHTVTTKVSPHNPTGFDVNRLVLASGAGGDAVPAASLVSTGHEGGSSPRVKVVRHGRTSMKVRVDPTDDPFWIVLGQSNNEGWTASVDGRDLGAPQLVDGYANGWRVDPKGLSGPLTISMTWAPQRTATLAGLISIVAALLCLGIVVVAWARRRRRAAIVAAAPAGASFELAPPSMHFGSVWPTVVTVGFTTLTSALLVRPWVGLLVGVLTLVALRWPRWRLLLRVGPAAIVAGLALYMAAGQYLERYPPRFDWPTFYRELRTPAWIAVMLIVADATIELVRRVAARGAGEPPADAA
jgi:arabinofuranan 3-O-arabinosyltransferase